MECRVEYLWRTFHIPNWSNLINPLISFHGISADSPEFWKYLLTSSVSNNDCISLHETFTMADLPRNSRPGFQDGRRADLSALWAAGFQGDLRSGGPAFSSQLGGGVCSPCCSSVDILLRNEHGGCLQCLEHLLN